VKRIADTFHLSRSNQYARKTARKVKYKPKPEDAKYLPLIRKITDERPTYGYRRVTAFINRLLEEKKEPPVKKYTVS